MKAKDLLIPRFELINNYPDCDKHKLAVGSIITFEYYNDETKQWYNDNGKSIIYDAYYEGYAHLFKKLNWWENRKKEDMPNKLICKAIPYDQEVQIIVEWDMELLIGWLDKKQHSYCSLNSFNPKYGYFPVD